MNLSIPIRISEKIWVARAPAQVWPYVVAPETYARWNTKIVQCDAKDAFYPGQQFSTQYQLRKERVHCRSQVVACEHEKLLELRHFNPVGDPKIRPDMEATERVTLTEKRGGTLVTKTVLIRRHGLPWWLMPIILLIAALGKPRTENPLKALVENAPKL